jgi:glycosyltransferase involved in cell wall biosynthesis
MISVFTPTYNRAPLLKIVYESLVLQNNSNFEWLIVDDGSTDGTEELINTYKTEAMFQIIYYKQANKGKHFAHNKGVQMAKGDLFLILDSDDSLPQHAIQQILEKYESIINNPQLGGVAGRRNYSDGTIVGGGVFDDLISNSLDIRYVHKVTGDLVEVFRTAILKEFPFPEIENEKFCPEALVWNRIAQTYDLLFFNAGIYTTEYLSNGLSAKIVQIRMESPIATMMCYSELEKYKIPMNQKLKANINFWRFSFNTKKYSFFQNIQKVNYFLSLIGYPLGFFMFLKDRKHIAHENRAPHK